MITRWSKARWHLTAYCTTHVYLWHAGRQLWCSLPRLSLVVICDTTPSTTSSSDLCGRRCWSQTSASLSRDNGKRPNGLTVLPWSNGLCMIWDFTYPHTLATSHLNRSALFAGAAANEAERRKWWNIAHCRLNKPMLVKVAVESLLHILSDTWTVYAKMCNHSMKFIATTLVSSSQLHGSINC